MEICLDRAWLNGFTQWDFQIVKQHFPSSHKEAERVFLLNFTIFHFNKHTIVRISLQVNTKVGQKTCFVFFLFCFFLPPCEGNFDMEFKFLLMSTYLYSLPETNKKKIIIKKNYFQTIGWTFENSSELFDWLLGYCIAFQSIQAKLVICENLVLGHRKLPILFFTNVKGLISFSGGLFKLSLTMITIDVFIWNMHSVIGRVAYI